MTDAFVTGLVLGAGGSKRLGRPKQLLRYGDGTLLGHVVDVARACPFDQVVVALGGAAEEVREAVDLDGVDVIVNAVIDALYETHGVGHIDMPCTPARVWRAMQGRAEPPQ